MLKSMFSNGNVSKTKNYRLKTKTYSQRKLTESYNNIRLRPSHQSQPSAPISQQPEVSEPSKPAPSEGFCGTCGAKAVEDAVFCPNCGTKS
jgi:hypothetical protein